jgi:hypothetical protein
MSALRALLLVLPIVAVACQGTGMGWIPSATDPDGKATFGFVFDATTGLGSFSGSYHDGAVRFKGTGVLRSAPPPAGMKMKGGCLLGEPAYESQNPAMPGAGTLTLWVCDGDGELAVTADDTILIIVGTGPYAGYSNMGSPSGNITVSSP